jgi:hypothetical protein
MAFHGIQLQKSTAAAAFLPVLACVVFNPLIGNHATDRAGKNLAMHSAVWTGPVKAC